MKQAGNRSDVLPDDAELDVELCEEVVVRVRRGVVVAALGAVRAGQRVQVGVVAARRGPGRAGHSQRDRQQLRHHAVVRHQRRQGRELLREALQHTPRAQYEVVRDACGREVPRHAHGQREAASLRRTAAHQERAHRLRTQHFQGYLE
uniref:SFRICE_022398 n=1 Tax=Spodoptera frugiperda TaxID=7108 RepID=A0A2H1WNF3_SPOFR